MKRTIAMVMMAMFVMTQTGVSYALRTPATAEAKGRNDLTTALKVEAPAPAAGMVTRVLIIDPDSTRENLIREILKREYGDLDISAIRHASRQNAILESEKYLLEQDRIKVLVIDNIDAAPGQLGDISVRNVYSQEEIEQYSDTENEFRDVLQRAVTPAPAAGITIMPGTFLVHKDGFPTRVHIISDVFIEGRLKGFVKALPLSNDRTHVFDGPPILIKEEDIGVIWLPESPQTIEEGEARIDNILGIVTTAPAAGTARELREAVEEAERYVVDCRNSDAHMWEKYKTAYTAKQETLIILREKQDPEAYASREKAETDLHIAMLATAGKRWTLEDAEDDLAKKQQAMRDWLEPFDEMNILVVGSDTPMSRIITEYIRANYRLFNEDYDTVIDIEIDNQLSIDETQIDKLKEIYDLIIKKDADGNFVVLGNKLKEQIMLSGPAAQERTIEANIDVAMKAYRESV